MKVSASGKPLSIPRAQTASHYLLFPIGNAAMARAKTEITKTAAVSPCTAATTRNQPVGYTSP